MPGRSRGLGLRFLLRAQVPGHESCPTDVQSEGIHNMKGHEGPDYPTGLLEVPTKPQEQDGAR